MNPPAAPQEVPAPEASNLDLDAIYRQEVPRYLLYVKARIGNPETAEEVVQQAVTELWQQREKIDPDRGPGGLLNHIVRARAIDVLRRPKGALPTDDTATLEQPVDDASETLVRQMAAQALAKRVLERLSGKRRLVALGIMAGLTYLEIAERHNMSHGNVHNLASRMRKELASFRAEAREILG